MKRAIIGVAVALLLAATVPVFAASEVFASYDKANDLNLYAELGYVNGSYFGGNGIGGALGLEYVAGNFEIGPLPFAWGIMGKGLVGVGFPGFGASAGAMLSLHLGLVWKLDFYIAAGLGIGIVPFGLGFAESAGIIWYFSDTMALLLDQTHAAGNTIAGVGIKMQL